MEIPDLICSLQFLDKNQRVRAKTYQPTLAQLKVLLHAASVTRVTNRSDSDSRLLAGPDFWLSRYSSKSKGTRTLCLPPLEVKIQLLLLREELIQRKELPHSRVFSCW